MESIECFRGGIFCVKRAGKLQILSLQRVVKICAHKFSSYLNLQVWLYIQTKGELSSERLGEICYSETGVQ